MWKKVDAEHKRLRPHNSGTSEEKMNAKFCLPSDLVALILSRLALKDNLCSSLVCKTWCEIAASVRVRDPPYWLMYPDRCFVRGVSYGFYDPIKKKKTKAMNLLELSISSHIACSNDGWLLMIDLGLHLNIFFFNPFTRECINLPRFEGLLSNYGFSCAPTKKGAFDPSARTWTVLPMEPIPSPGPHVRTVRWMTNYKGQIFLVDASSPDPMVFRQNRLEMVWEEKEILDGSSVFVCDGSCVMTTGLTGSMSNIVNIWNSHNFGKYLDMYHFPLKRNRPNKYSLYSRSFCEDPEGYYFEYQTENRINGAWIEPPHDISIFDFSILDPSNAINTPLLILSLSFILLLLKA
ncbi:unnamed protein product [Arabis nemorensis]|uniref:F-box domain-containing protein n=1 Tax=Arabis nemorensis TaxID=586526 RepID=A0A565CPZ2_9BRAS|nr:unnamed protein product [Arabis nemorensis]